MEQRTQEPRPVAFTNEGVAYKAYPEQGSFFGVEWVDGKAVLLQIPMNAEGGGEPAQVQPTGCWQVVEVTNMHEDGDEALLEQINADFGTTFKQSDFAGR